MGTGGGSAAACPRCERLSAEATLVLQELADRLPPVLRAMPPERLGILVKWTLVALSNPRVQWPPPPPPTGAKTARRSLAQVVEDLGGVPPPPPRDLAGSQEEDGGD